MTVATTDPHAASERVQALLAELGAESPQVADRAEELVRQLMQLYGAALGRIVETTREGEGDASPMLKRLVDDDLVASLLVLHDLHPYPLEERVQAALDKVRPYLGSHGGSVEIVGIEDDTVHIRMAGSCNGCPSSAVTLTYAIERAIIEAAPEIARVVADDLEQPAVSSLVQIGDVKGGEAIPPPAPTWSDLELPESLVAGQLRSQMLGGTRLLLLKAGEDLFAYRNACPQCGSYMERGMLAAEVLSCPGCGQEFDVRHAGRSLGSDELHMSPLPLLVDGDRIRVAVPAIAG